MTRRCDSIKGVIDSLRDSADQSNAATYDEACAKFCKSMNDTLAAHIQCVLFVFSAS